MLYNGNDTGKPSVYSALPITWSLTLGCPLYGDHLLTLPCNGLASIKRDVDI
jgi:hypothetical protein